MKAKHSIPEQPTLCSEINSGFFIDWHNTETLAMGYLMYYLSLISIRK